MLNAYAQVYIAGPMTGIPNLNWPAFDRAEAIMRDMGVAWAYTNPAELDRRLGLSVKHNVDLATLLASDFRYLVNCDAIVLLDGWGHSKGANCELAVARMMGMPAYVLIEGPEGWVLVETFARPSQSVLDAVLTERTAEAAERHVERASA